MSVPLDHRPRRPARLLAALPLLLAAPAWAQASAQDAPETLPAGAADPAPATRPAEPRTDALVNRMLDAPVQLDLDNRPLPQVLDAITAETGVPFFVGDDTYALLPYGRQTPISVKVAETPLRQTLEAITRKLGLRFALADERVELRPMPPLERAGRRATVEEIAMLDLLAGVRLDLVDARPTVAQLLEEVDLKLADLDAAAAGAGRPSPGFVVENRLDDDLRGRPVFVARDATLATAMEAIDQQTRATWYPWGDTLVVVPKDAWVRRMLERPVNLRYDRVELPRVLNELEAAAGVPFRVEPGALLRVPEAARRVRLFLDNATVREALESLSGVTGLSYGVDADGLYLWNADPATGNGRLSGRPGARNGGPAELPVLSVDMGDGTSLLIYPGDLPPDLLGRIDARRRDAIDSLRNGGNVGDGDAPATRPQAAN